MSTITGSRISAPTGAQPSSVGGAYSGSDGTINPNVSRQTGTIILTYVEPFNLGVVGVESVELFNIAQANVGAETVEPFNIVGNAATSSVEPFYQGAGIAVDSVEPFRILSPAGGGIYPSGHPASPLLGYWRRG